jgi:hypothetical protein
VLDYTWYYHSYYIMNLVILRSFVNLKHLVYLAFENAGLKVRDICG